MACIVFIIVIMTLALQLSSLDPDKLVARDLELQIISRNRGIDLECFAKIIRFLVPEFTVGLLSSMNKIIDFQTGKTSGIKESLV